MANLSEAVREYGSALDAGPAGGGEGAALAVAHILLARDRVARGLEEEGGPALSAADLHALAEQDRRLRDAAKRYVALVGRPTFAGWREAYRPQADHWWWHLDAPAETAGSKLYPLWAIFTGLLLAATVSFAIDTFQRTRGGGAKGFWGTLPGAVSVVFTLLAGAPFVQVLRQLVENVQRRVIRVRFGGVWAVSVAGCALVAVLAWRGLALTDKTEELRERVYAGLIEGRGHDAIESGERMLADNPKDWRIRGLVAMAYEKEGKYDEAVKHYLEEIRLMNEAAPPDMPRPVPSTCMPHNQIARIYLRRKDFTKAKEYLDQVTRVADCQEDYHTQLNLGWAAFLLPDLDRAEEHLAGAARIFRFEGSEESHVAGAHCLLAQVLEARRAAAKGAADGPERGRQGKDSAGESGRELAEINRQWEQCAKSVSRDTPEPEWLTLAHQRLTQAAARAEAAAARSPEGARRPPR